MRRLWSEKNSWQVLESMTTYRVPVSFFQKSSSDVWSESEEGFKQVLSIKSRAFHLSSSISLGKTLIKQPKIDVCNFLFVLASNIFWWINGPTVESLLCQRLFQASACPAYMIQMGILGKCLKTAKNTWRKKILSNSCFQSIKDA